MIDMGVSEKNTVDIRWRQREITIYISVRPLLHAVVNQNFMTAYCEQRTAAGDFMSGT